MSASPELYLGWRDVQPLFGGISRTTAWRGVRAGWLPSPVQVSLGRRAWRASDVADWQTRLQRRRPPEPSRSSVRPKTGRGRAP